MITKLRFEAKTARVKCTSFHPSKPWVLISMRSGEIELWDYNLKISIATFQQHEGGVRGVDFHPQLPLFVSGGDDGLVKVWDYKQKRCTFTLKGHIDYIRTTFFHHELPWILSACDDQTMRIWNYQSRACVNIITGHSHYVMCAQFHHEKNLIVSASLDSTIRLWDYTILKKKLTQSKNVSAFVGIEIECIKVLEGHERGANWVCFHPTQNLIASASDDRKIKLWKYTNEVAWEHSTLGGHKNNVSCVLFDSKTGTLISNSEDKTTKTWNIESKTQVSVIKRQSDRYWIISQAKNGALIALGHDKGFEIYAMDGERTPHGIIGEKIIVFAENMKTHMYDIEKKTQKEELYQYKPKAVDRKWFINNIIVNRFEPNTFMVEVDEGGIYNYTVKIKESGLNFPFIVRSYDGIDSCFISQSHVAVLASPHEIHIMGAVSKDDRSKQVLKLNKQMSIKRIFSSIEPNVVIFVTDDTIAQYDTAKNIILGQESLEDSNVRSLVFSNDKIAIVTKAILYITNQRLETITKIHEKFSIKSAFWERENVLLYTTVNHWKYALMNGQNGILKTLEKPIHLLKKLNAHSFLAFEKERKIFQIEFPSCLEIDFKLAVAGRNWQLTKKLIKKSVEENKKYMVSYLVEKGLASMALQIVEDPKEKFSLAIQATNFQLAFEICNKINTPEYWKLLGDEALQQGIYEAYELANQKLKNLDKLSFLYSLQSNSAKLQKIQKLANKTGNLMLAFNTSLFMNSQQDSEKNLRECGLEKLAALSAESRQEPSEHSELLRRLNSKPLEPCQPEEDEPDFSNWPHNVTDLEEDE